MNGCNGDVRASGGVEIAHFDFNSLVGVSFAGMADCLLDKLPSMHENQRLSSLPAQSDNTAYKLCENDLCDDALVTLMIRCQSSAVDLQSCRCQLLTRYRLGGDLHGKPGEQLRCIPPGIDGDARILPPLVRDDSALACATLMNPARVRRPI